MVELDIVLRGGLLAGSLTEVSWFYLDFDIMWSVVLCSVEVCFQCRMMSAFLDSV